MEKLSANTGTTWGTDPEAFFKQNGNIIGSEKLIPKRGIGAGGEKIVRDGVQFELHPLPNSDLRQVTASLAGLLVTAGDVARKRLNTSICFDGLVTVTREELDSLAPENKVLGCMPSLNLYGAKPIQVDPLTYRKRSSGGHVHMGISSKLLFKQRESLVPLCDILVGNTCVLLDRDPGAYERRYNYGRAGEFRKPKHGIEYRTTSNFWLRDPALMDFVFGMANLAVSIAQEAAYGNKSAWDDLEKLVKINQIILAINTNNFKVALDNFTRIVPFLQAYLPERGFPLTPENIPSFVRLVNDAHTRGIEQYFTTDGIIQRWSRGIYEDFPTFLRG